MPKAQLSDVREGTSSIKDFRDKEELSPENVEHGLGYAKREDVAFVISNRLYYDIAIEKLAARNIGKRNVSLADNTISIPWPIN